MDTISELFSESQLKSLNRDAPTPLYFRLYSLLKDAILNGTLDNGAKMPTEQQLAEHFDVSRITAKRAMDELAAEGLVARQRGKGTHVTYEYKPQPLKAPLVGMLQEIESMARHSDVKVVECKRMKPPAHIRDALGLNEDDSALYLLRVRSRDNLPFGYYESWTSGLEQAVGKRDFARAPRLEIFRKQGLDISHVTQTISAVAASGELVNELQTEKGAPLLNLVRHSFIMRDGEEQLVDWLEVFYHPQRFQYRMDLDLDSAG